MREFYYGKEDFLFLSEAILIMYEDEGTNCYSHPPQDARREIQGLEKSCSISEHDGDRGG